jgi:protein phosphatase
MKIEIPDFCLVLLIGASGSGKSTFARAHFKPTEIVSSDHYRGVVDDDENSLEASGDAFAACRFVTATRLKRRKLTVIDATNVRAEDRANFTAIAKQYHALTIGIVIDPGEGICHHRNEARPDRQFGPHVVRNQMANMRRGLNRPDKEGIRYLHRLEGVDKIAATTITRTRTWTDARHVTGPFDIIGDVHGCADELQALLEKLGYLVGWRDDTAHREVTVTPPAGRRAVFLGDLVDRGPNSPDVLRIVMSMVKAETALCVLGNHDIKFWRWLSGKKVTLTHGLDKTVAQVEEVAKTDTHFKREVAQFINKLISHFWLDTGTLAVAHAGVREDMIGRASGAVREFCLYGETTGESDEFGLPIRHNWAADYRGKTVVVYGHTPSLNAEWLNDTICIDTGCVFGGRLTALRWPERELVDVKALQVYAEPKRPLAPPAEPQLTAQQAQDDLLDIDLVIGKHIVTTTLANTVTIDAAQSAAALEVMARFAVNPKWLIHLPPTMSPCATTLSQDLPDNETSHRLASLLEQPAAAFEYYRDEGVTDLFVEEKHMGSRALLIVCRNVDAARTRFGITTGETGIILTRTGRAFFNDANICEGLLARVRAAMTEVRFWERHATDWALLDAELMPWSAKAQGLITSQYAPTAAAANAGLGLAASLFAQAAARDPSAVELAKRFAARNASAQKYADAYRRYCWPVASLDDYRIAPFHVLATEGAVHMDMEHIWHMTECARLAEPGDKVLVATTHHVVDLTNEASVDQATDWWLALTQAGGEGMVVKPRSFIARGRKGLMQPAIKVRGHEYLRIIYGPEYDLPDNLARLRKRGLGKKRSLAYREFILGHEALTRFVAKQPLRKVHEAVFAILALESEPVDPRL